MGIHDFKFGLIILQGNEKQLNRKNSIIWGELELGIAPLTQIANK